jgi:hypothetical protein
MTIDKNIEKKIKNLTPGKKNKGTIFYFFLFEAFYLNNNFANNFFRPSADP